MQHSTPTLTAKTYTAPKLLDMAGALDALPDLPLDGGSLVAPNVALAGGKSCDSESFGVNSERIERGAKNTDTIRKIANIDRHIQRQATHGAEKKMVEMNGIEASTSCPSDKFNTPDNEAHGKELGKFDSDRCTNGCTIPVQL